LTLRDQTLVGVVARTGEGAERLCVVEKAANEMKRIVRRFEPVALCQLAHGTHRSIEKVLSRLHVHERHVVVSTGTEVVAEGLRHETRHRAMLARNGLHHEAEEGEPVCSRQGIGIAKVYFELTASTFLIEGVKPPAESFDIARQFFEEWTGH